MSQRYLNFRAKNKKKNWYGNSIWDFFIVLKTVKCTFIGLIVMRNFLQSLSECHPQTSMSNVLEIDCCLEGILTIAITVYQKSYRDMYYQRHHTCSKYCIQFSCSKLCILHYCIRQIMAHLTPEIIRAYCSNKQLMVFGLRKSQIHKAKVM